MEMNRQNIRNCEGHERDRDRDCERDRDRDRDRDRERNNREFREVCIDGILFRFRLNEIREGVSELVAVPCQQPTLILCVAEIRRKENCCTNMPYFQATVNNHTVEIIQDCSLEKIIKEAIRVYIENSVLLCAGNNRRRNNEWTL